MYPQRATTMREPVFSVVTNQRRMLFVGIRLASLYAAYHQAVASGNQNQATRYIGYVLILDRNPKKLSFGIPKKN